MKEKAIHQISKERVYKLNRVTAFMEFIERSFFIYLSGEEKDAFYSCMEKIRLAIYKEETELKTKILNAPIKEVNKHV